MTLEQAKKANESAYKEWLYYYGMPEAYEPLNDSNRQLIRAYLAENPKARGYKAYEGIIDFDLDNLENSCADYIFDGSAEGIAEIEGEPEEMNRLDIVEEHDGICLVWC